MDQDNTSHYSMDAPSKDTQKGSPPIYLVHAEGYLSKNSQPNLSKENLEFYFQQQSTSLDPLLSPPKLIYWKTDLFEYCFNTRIFIKSLFFYILYFFLLGPILLILRRIFKVPILNNLIMPTIGSEALLFVLVIFVTPFGYLSFTRDDCEVLRPAVIVIWMNLIFVIVAQASMTAFTNQSVSELLTSTMLSRDQVQSLKKVEIGNEGFELRNTFNRLKINISRLYFDLMEDKEGEVSASLKKKVESEQKSAEYLIQDGWIFLPKLVTKENLVQEALDFEERIFNMKSSWQKTHLDDHKMFGYNLATSVLAANKQEISSIIKRFIYWGGLLQAGAIYGGELLQIFLDLKNITFLFILNTIFYLGLVFIITYIIDLFCIAFLNLKTRKAYMLHLGELLIPGNNRLGLNLNVFDYMSLKTWTTLRKVFMHYGDRQMETIGLVITLFTGSHIIVGVLLFLDYMHAFNILSDGLRNYVVPFFIGGLFFMGFLVVIIYQALSINKQYHVHKELIRKNREFVVSMYRLYPNYIVQEQPLEPENSFEAQALKLLLKEFGNNPEEQKMESRLRMLTETYDDILKDLEFEEQNYPIRLVGIKIAPNLVKTLLVAAISAGFASIVKYISNLTSAGL